MNTIRSSIRELLKATRGPSLSRHHSGDRGERGQALAMFALVLVVVLAAAGMLIDGGRAWVERRAAQNAADTAALAAARAVANGGYTCNATGRDTATNAATNIANVNGYTNVDVHFPPVNSSKASINGSCSYIEVDVSSTLSTTFSRVVGQNSWPVSARAISQVAQGQIATCNFCALNSSTQNHTLLVNLGSQLRVDGSIYVNSKNGGTGPGCTTKSWNVCGDGFDIFGTGGTISAATIQTVGGWETHDQDVATADGVAVSGCSAPDPPSYSTVSPTPVSNVCIHQPVLPDPLSYVPTPVYSDYTAQVGSSSQLTALKISGGTTTIQPGIYWGGIQITNNANVTFAPGVYIMATGGLTVSGNATINAPNVMIYNGSNNGGGTDSGPGPSAPASQGHPTVDIELLFQTNPVTASQNDQITAHITRDSDGVVLPDHNGTVDFYVGMTLLCSNIAVSKGDAKCTKSFAAGTQTITAIYSGSANFDPAEADSDLVVTPAAGKTGAISIDTTGSVTLGPSTTGPYAGMTIFSDRSSTSTITLNPSNAAQCATTAGSGQPQGCMGGISGTIYAANQNALTSVKASGTANLQVISGKILITNGSAARFTYKPQGFAGSTLQLAE
jgi:Flp pilus assembly protein TadG